jgi:hypothetical protein
MAELPKDMIFHYHSDDGITIKVDAIPLVRCGECKHRNDLTPTKRHPCVDMAVDDDWFCADGERRGQE